MISGNESSRLPLSSIWRTLNAAVLPVAFFCALAVPVLKFGVPILPAGTIQENRKMAAPPKPMETYGFENANQWFSDFNSWFNDNFGGRDVLVHYGARADLIRTGVPANANVVLGKDGWLFYDMNYQKGQPRFAEYLGRNRYTPEVLARMGANLEKVRSALSACGIPFYFVLAADKQTVYPEKLRMSFPEQPGSRTTQFMTYLSQTYPQIKSIDLRGPMIAAKASEKGELYKRTDTHWNALGAFYGYKTVTDRLVADGIVKPTWHTDRSRYQVTEQPFAGGDIAINMLSVEGMFKDYVYTVTSGTPHTGQYSTGLPNWPVIPGDDHFVSFENPSADGTLLLYRDSFGAEMFSYLSEDYRHLYTTRTWIVDGKDVAAAKPDVVIFEIVERYLTYLEQPPVNLGAMCAK
ncbi:alginate O-acetyltransferase [Pandoraea iniqua]|uniref:alginate O-acetyltransferase AlgX-related protein n=1 Tax=Pandoraea iniqua TaxID=2508288 RepID=UPI001240CAA1|nr:alginate O-acetyltransferase [Pandoraea iniqua]VVE59441.1 alginate O-acetyltransferase [Pandoraea iniqua]